MTNDELIDASTSIGYLLLENGAEIFRVEESIRRILQAYGVPEADVFAITSFVAVTITNSDKHSTTKTKRVYSRVMNLEKVQRLNSLCRRVCRETPEYAAIQEELARVERCPAYPLFLQVLAFGLISSSFTLFFGGGPWEAAGAFLCGMAVKAVCWFMEKFQSNPFFIHITAAAIMTFLALLEVHLGLGAQSDKIIIGTLMTLVPGVGITNSMRDIIAGDLIAGLMKLTEALLIATAIALGAGLALSLTRLIFGG